ncbi:MAG: alpha/beta fold hydrolase [Pseudomonadota bacterium]
MKAEIKPKRGPVLVSMSGATATRSKLVCFHFAGGSAQSFFRWRTACPGGIGFLAAEMPGRGRRFSESFVPSIAEAAEEFADTLASEDGSPSVFFGHSLGAIVAYETAALLKKRGHQGPSRLIVSSSPSPGWRSGVVNFPNLTDASLIEYLRSLDGTPASVMENKVFMQMALRILRSDLALLNQYDASQTRIDAPVDVIGGSSDETAPLESLLAWRQTTAGTFRLFMIDGGHFTLLDQPQVVMGLLPEPEMVRG